MSEKKFNTFVAVFIGIASTILLVGAQLDVEPHAPAYVGETKFKRGEVIRSGNQFSHVRFGPTEIWLDTDTEIQLLDGREGSFTITVIQGRVVTKGEITITVREVRTTAIGSMSFVHYSWEDRIEVASADGLPVIMEWPEGGTIFETAANARTLPPYEAETTVFDPQHSSAAAFYSEVLK